MIELSKRSNHEEAYLLATTWSSILMHTIFPRRFRTTKVVREHLYVGDLDQGFHDFLPDPKAESMQG